MAESSIVVAAAGESSRMMRSMQEAGMPAGPKHLLPAFADSDVTLLGSNLASALGSDLHVVLHVNQQNHNVIVSHPDVRRFLTDVEVAVQPDIRPLGPFSFMTDPVLHGTEGDTHFSIAGDVFLEDFNWADFIASHESAAGTSMSLLAGVVDAPAQSAIFGVRPDGSNIITGFQRYDTPRRNVLRNVGVYAVRVTPELTEPVTRYLDAGEHEQSDPLFRELAEAGLARVIEHRGYFKNMNTLADYQEHLDRDLEAAS